MKYELEPDNRNCSDEELLADLRFVASKLARQSLTKDLYDEHGRFCSATMRKRFCTWNKALELSGLVVQKRVDIPSSELIEDLRRVADEIGKRSVTREEYRDFGRFADITFSRQFGSWTSAIELAGLDSTGWKPPATEEILFDNMASVWEHVGRQPKQKDFSQLISKYSTNTYVNHYGSWRSALEAFVQAANSENESVDEQNEVPQPTATSTAVPIEHKRKTSRNPSWRLRFLVMRRDNFTCRLCGASPAKDPAVVLHIDHIHPWSEGGETILPNLQTCCQVCNIGKSDLPI